MLKLGLVSDLAETGFGRVGRELGKRWLDAGHDLRVIGINFGGREDAVRNALAKGEDGDGIKAAFESVAMDPVLSRAVPAGIKGDGMGHNLTKSLIDGELASGWKPDRVVFIADPVASLHRQATDGGALGAVPSFNYVPIEGSDLSVFWRAIWEHVTPVAMSRFGQREISKVLGRDDVPYIPHGISAAFYRISPEHPAWTSDDEMVTSKEAAKADFGWQDRTVILRADRFVDRKGYPEYFEVIRRIIAERPEVLFVIHCAVVDEGGMMSQLLADLPGAYRDGKGWHHSQVVLTRAHDTFKGMSDSRLNLLYNAADIYASTSYAEGFGLTLAEAAACGVPVVANDFAAIPEAVGLGGLLVEPAEIIPTSHGHHWAAVDIDDFADTLMELIDEPSWRLDLGAKGEAHVARFDWDKAALDFLNLMEDNPRWQR
jgi:glycosyltransferase involved in cell wall biosynthesis